MSFDSPVARKADLEIREKRTMGPLAAPTRVDEERAHRGGVVLAKDSYSSGQAAKIIGIPARTMRHYLNKGRIPGEQNPITGTWHVRRETLMELLEREGRTVVSAPQLVKLLAYDEDPGTLVALKNAARQAFPNMSLNTPRDVCDAVLQIGTWQPEVVVIGSRKGSIGIRDILGALRKNPTTAVIKVIALGSSPDEFNELRAMGADAVLLKPLQVSAFVETLEKLAAGPKKMDDEPEDARTLAGAHNGKG